MLRKLYDKTLALARSRYAVPTLGGVAFTESFIFPIPPDVILLPMMFAQTKTGDAYKRVRIWWLAGFATLCSTLGAGVAYILGTLAWDIVSPLVGGEAAYAQFQTTYASYGVWVVLVAAISFIPFKLATLASGALGAPIVPFIAAAFIGRGIRFFLLATLVYFFGRDIIANIEKYFTTLSWVVLALALISIYLIWA
ncbi:MAG: DedA family protein [Alphaproteobacteria bacterium]|nr:DedA family protein [Alphaproteobacteria bacterium]